MKKILIVIALLLPCQVVTATDFAEVRTTTGGVAVHINSNMPQQVGLTIGTTSKTGSQEGGGGGCIKWFTDDAPVPPQVEGYLQGNACLMPSSDPSMRRLKIEAIEQGTGYRDVTINEQGGNVAVGATHADARLHVRTDSNNTGYIEALRIDGQGLSNGWERGISFVGNNPAVFVGTITAYLVGLEREIRIYAGGNLVFRINQGGAVIIGNPSGGFMGPGTLNVQGQIYRNGTPVP